MLESWRNMAIHRLGIRSASIQGALFLLLALLFLSGCGGEESPQVRPTPTLQATPTQSPVQTPRVTQITPTPGPVGTPTVESNIVVELPKSGDEVRGLVTVKGKARVFEAVVNISVKDGNGREVGSLTAMASEGAPGWGDFDVKVPFSVPGADPRGVVEVFWRSPRDGSVQDLVKVPVRLVPG